MIRTIPTNINKWLILTIIIIGYFLAFLDLVVINIMMPSIIDFYKEGIGKSEWLISGYSLSMSIVILCSVWLTQKYGFKQIYILGIITFTLGSFLCDIAQNMNYLIAARLLQGVGSGIIIPISMTIIANTFDESKRGLGLGLLIMSTGVAVSTGPLLASYFMEINDWRLIFRINIPIGILLITASYMIIKNVKGNTTSKFDYIGFILLLIWAPLSLYILSSNGDWKLIIVAIIAFTLFVLRMIYARNPMINIFIFKNRDFALAAILMLCFGAVLLGANYIMSEYLLYGLHYSDYKSGAMFLPVGIMLGITAPITGYLTHKYGCRKFIILGLSITLVYLYLSSRLTLDTPYWYILLTQFLRGISLGVALTAITNLAFSGFKAVDIPSASGVINMIKQLSESFSVAIITMFLLKSHSQTSGINKYIYATDLSFLLLSGLIAIAIITVLLSRRKV